TVNNGAPQSASFRVRKDPRSTSTDADILAQFNLLIAIRDKTTEANNAVRMVRNMRAQVEDRTGRLTGDNKQQFTGIATGMMSNLTKAEQEAYQVRNESNQDPLNFPIKLNNEIAGVASYVSQGEYRPTRQAIEVFNMLSRELDVHLKAIQSSLDSDLPRLNAILRAAGLPELKPSTEEVKRQRPAVAM
ncbi:MAG: glycosyl hydrolase, partial [Gemmatimonadota bacterium]